ncbi:MAG: DUF72 domain-containing protein [Chloroflexi bacterium]|nr:DUF72 domain-containing protein [Chloroflexota bacterium]
MTRVHVGTCSWADHQSFYPEGLPANRQIAYYASQFPIVEVNSSFYRLMPARNYALWAERTPPGFVFDVKPYRQLTWHDRETPPDEAVTEAFRQSLAPLRQAAKLGAVHFQFPPWFVYRPENVEYLRQVRQWFADDRLSVEFRHRSWLEGPHLPQLLETMRAERVGLTVVDEPQVGSGSVPTVLEVTTPELVVLRFHGRNAKMWYAKVRTTAERFDYLYTEDELRPWADRIGSLASQAQEIHVLFNNNARDYAVQNARQLTLLLEERLGHAVARGQGCFPG